MSETDPHLFGSSDLLMDAMGHWPSFHDAEVKSVLREGDSCRVVIQVHEMTGEVGPDGYYVLTKHHLVTVQMTGIVECTLPTDYTSDVLLGLHAQRAERFVNAHFDSAIDPQLSWRAVCKELTLIEVVPCDAGGSVAARPGR
jgi:hypothetical protein